MEEFVTTKELTQKLKVTIATINNMINDGRLPKPDVSGGRGSKRLWKLSTLTDWFDGK